jgi:predicted small secreted protein
MFSRTTLLAALLALPNAGGCHNTAQGIKEDTKRALDKTGQKLEKAADKIGGEHQDSPPADKKKDGQ